jgi:hypothetical protein
MLARFDIVLVAFPFTDGPNVKPRPALVICQSERHQDVLLALISSKISGAIRCTDAAGKPAKGRPHRAVITQTHGELFAGNHQGAIGPGMAKGQSSSLQELRGFWSYGHVEL